MRAKIELMIDAYVADEAKRQMVKDFVEHLIKRGHLIINIDNIAVRTYDRNMNKADYPLTMIGG